MSHESIIYETAGAVATITLNRPERQNAIRADMALALDEALRHANWNNEIKVIVIEGAGDGFCSGFDVSGGLEHHSPYQEDGYDPGVDLCLTANRYTSGIEIFMGLWRGLKPTIAKVHGYCLGAGSELALCADLVIAADDARFGTPYSRVWGCHLTGMWVYRLGLAKAKYHALTGEWISGTDAAAIELINASHPLDQLDDHVDELATRLGTIPLSQLAAMKLIVNQAYDNMGLQSTQTLGPILDGIMRNTGEGRDFIRLARDQGVKAAVARRDAPFGDYSQAPPDQQPAKRRTPA
jgi:enoyl-CoA hydratase